MPSHPLSLVLSKLRPHAARLLAAFAVLLVPAAALAQVTYTGTAANQNFGSVAVGSTSAPQTFSFSVAAGTTIGSIGVMTQGVPNLDFASASGETCTAKTYTSAATCTLNVTFTATAPGTRPGGVVFFSATGSTGTVLGQVLVHGIRSGPMISFGAPVLSPHAPFSFPANAQGLAIDGDDNLFTAGLDGSSIVKFNCSASCTSGSLYWGGVGAQVESLAMDGAGNLSAAIEFTSNPNYPRNDYAVVKIPPGGGAATYLTTTGAGTFDGNPQGVPISLAVDGADNVYLAHITETQYLNAVFPASGSGEVTQNLTVGGQPINGLAAPMVFDGAGNMYAHVGCNIFEFPAGQSEGTELQEAPICMDGIVLDAEGNLYGTSQDVARFYELGPGASSWNELIDLGTPTGPGDYTVGYPVQLVMDGRDNLFEMAYKPGDPHSNPTPFGTFFGLSLPQSPTLNFATPTGVGTDDKADGTKQVEVKNIGNAPLELSAVTFPADFTGSTGYSDECTSSSSVSVGGECTLRVNFLPENTGPLSENVLLTDNALNVSGAQQSIAVSGTGIADNAAIITTPTAGSKLSGSSVTFTWTGGVGATQYHLLAGTWGPGAANVYDSYGIAPATTSVTIPMPTGGVTLFVRLWQELDGVDQYAVYTYAEVGTLTPAVISSPTSGSTLTATNVTFNWAGSSSPAEYVFRAGTTGQGSKDLYDSGGITATSQTISDPANGITIYVQLWQLINSTWQVSYYTYTESGTPTPAVVTSPSPGSTLTGTSITFNWAGGAGPIAYQFLVGTHGVGSGNLLNTYQTHATSATVTIPSNGERIWVRLNQEINGVWTSTDYTYTADSTP